MDYSAITDEADADFAIRLTKEHGVASIPTSPFLRRQPAPTVLRFCFAKRDETLERRDAETSAETTAIARNFSSAPAARTEVPRYGRPC